MDFRTFKSKNNWSHQADNITKSSAVCVTHDAVLKTYATYIELEILQNRKKIRRRGTADQPGPFCVKLPKEIQI